MKNLLLITIFILGLFSFSFGADVEKKGFLTTKWCAEHSKFTNCPLETAVCGTPGCYRDWNFGDKQKLELVLFVHDEGKTYNINVKKFKKKHEIDHGMNRNLVTVIGKRRGNTIYAHEFKAPPPPAKSFFKGCL